MGYLNSFSCCKNALIALNILFIVSTTFRLNYKYGSYNKYNIHIPRSFHVVHDAMYEYIYKYILNFV